MASVTSLDKDLRKMRLDKYTPQAADEAKQWIEGVLGERLQTKDLLEGLKDGVALCKLVNLLLPSPGVKYKQSAMPFVQMENISHFLRACQSPPINLQPHDLFLTVDLYEQKDPAQVLQCLGAFSRMANSLNPSKFPKAIGPKARTGATMSPQGTRSSTPTGYGYTNRMSRGVSNASSALSTGSRDGAATPTRFAERSQSPTKATRPPPSPQQGGVSSWSKRQDEGVTSPAWNIAQYGYMGGASQGNMGISFGGRRQITSAGPYVPNMAEKEKRRREQEAEEESARQAAEEAEDKRKVEREAEEERARIEEEERWAEEERKLREKAAEEKRKWDEDERRWKEEEERRLKEEKEAEEKLEKEKREARRKSEVRLEGQFLSQYQSEHDIGRRDRSRSPGHPRSRVEELERELELARQREAQYERERQERQNARSHRAQESLDMSSHMRKEESRSKSRTRSKSRSRPLPRERRNSEESWIPDEREYLRREWKKQQDHPHPHLPPRGLQQHQEAAPAKSPRPLPQQPQEDEPVFVTKNHTGPSSRPLPDPKVYRSPPQQQGAFPQPVEQASVPASRTERYLQEHPAPQVQPPRTQYANELGAFDSTAERDAEDRRRQASQQKTKAGGWASKSLLEREMEMERQRQREWEEAQKATAEAAKHGEPRDGIDGIGGGIGGKWDVNQWTGYTGGDSQNKGGQGIGAGRRQIVGPRPPPGK